MTGVALRGRERAVRLFRERFGQGPELLVRAPGRVNLIGEHVDYNDGWVLPAAIDRAAWVAAGRGAGDLVSIHSADLSDRTAFHVSRVERRVDSRGDALADWARYPAGIAWALREQRLAVSGLRAVVASDVPIGAGLSSSAALEVAFAVTWRALGDWTLDDLELARICQRAESGYVGVACGMMDPFASLHGRKGQALLLDCRTLECETLPLPAQTAIVVADSGVRRDLASTEFNTRRSECRRAVELLEPVLPGIRALRDVSGEDFQRHGERLPPLLRRRAQHVVEEIARVRAVVPAVRAGNAAALGHAMTAAHESGRILYEVSCFELDVLVEEAGGIAGCFGSRLTGAGFGGCTVHLVVDSRAPQFADALAQRYEARTGRRLTAWICQAADGAAVV